jgi:hypothetical protein
VISELVELGPVGAYSVTIRQRMQSQLKQLKAVSESPSNQSASSRRLFLR